MHPCSSLNWFWYVDLGINSLYSQTPLASSASVAVFCSGSWPLQCAVLAFEGWQNAGVVFKAVLETRKGRWFFRELEVFNLRFILRKGILFRSKKSKKHLGSWTICMFSFPSNCTRVLWPAKFLHGNFADKLTFHGELAGFHFLSHDFDFRNESVLKARATKEESFGEGTVFWMDN